MSQSPKLSTREWDVIQHLLQGKSNKLIASSLDISVRTVEFHLKNIYAKFRVSSRIELILKLGNATGGLETKKLRCSTVDTKEEIAENRDKPALGMKRATSFTETVSIIGKELKMKNLMNVRLAFMGIIAALLAGLLWSVMWNSAPNNLFIPLIIVLVLSGLIVGIIGKQRGESPLKVLVSVIVGIGLSPLAVIPLLMLAVLPLYRIAQVLGVFDLSSLSAEAALNLETGVLVMLVLITSVVFGIALLIKVLDNRQSDQLERSA